MSRPEDRAAVLRARMLDIVAEAGLDRLSVREVAAAAAVSIGTVQHYFPSKDAMLRAAFGEVVARIRRRVDHVRLGADPRRNLESVLAQLLPLDDERRVEARVQLAFSARAAVAPELATIQEQILAEVRAGLVEGFVHAGQPAARARTSAVVALACVDGLAQHAVSAPGSLSAQRLRAGLRSLLDALI